MICDSLPAGWISGLQTMAPRIQTRDAQFYTSHVLIDAIICTDATMKHILVLINVYNKVA
jgi:hypothetical protein